MRHLNSLQYFEVVAGEKSIRQAADKLHITATALNRRILALEDEIGVPLFERLASGVRLNPAGELLLQHVRTQRIDLSRVMSQISDLSGLRRGHVRLACSPELLSGFIPQQIAEYRRQFPAVEYTVESDSPDIMARLESLDIDLALSFTPVMPHRSQQVGSIEQTLHVLLDETHPLARQSCLRLHDCLDYPVVMAHEDTPLSTQLTLACTRKNLQLKTVLRTDSPLLRQQYVRHEQAVSFDYPISYLGASAKDSVLIPLDKRDSNTVLLSIYKAKGRVLPIAVGKFLDQMLAAMYQHFSD